MREYGDKDINYMFREIAEMNEINQNTHYWVILKRKFILMKSSVMSEIYDCMKHGD